MAPLPKYIRKTFRLDELHLRDAVAISNDEQFAKTVVEWRDAKTVGLTIRIIPGKPVWYVRRQETTLRLRDVRELSVEDARYVAEQIRLAAGRKRNLKDMTYLLVGAAARPSDGGFRPDQGDHAERLDRMLADRERVKTIAPPPFWTWKRLTEEFLANKKTKLKAKYRKAYEHYLTLPEFDGINHRMVREIKLRDLESVRNAIHINHAPSAVHRALTQSKKMLTWAWKFKASEAGLDEVEYEWWNRWSYEYQTRKRTHTPKIEEIARTLVIAERFRKLANGEHETYPGTLGALWGVALTGQRTGAFLQLRRDRLFDASKGYRKLKGWKIASWTADEMKGGRDGGRPHSIPMPPEALNILNKFYAESENKSDWMFSGRDPKKHITQAALNLLMYRLQGRVYDHTIKQKPSRKGKPGPKPKPNKARDNLFQIYGIERWTLHDCRRTITSFLVERKLGGAATAILGHKTPHDEIPEREKLAPVAATH
jgi:integrase